MGIISFRTTMPPVSSPVRSPRIAGRLAGLASVDLVWRIPQLTPGDSAGVDVAVALLALALDIGDVGLFEELTTWLLLGYVAAVLAPQAYPAKLGVPAGKLSYRVPFAFVTVLTAAGLRSTSDGGSRVELVTILTVMALCGVFLLVSLQRGQGWTLSPEDERFVQLIDAVYPSRSVEAELREDFARSGVLGVVGVASARGAAATILVFPAFLSGIAVVVLLTLYPLPDLLIQVRACLPLVGHVTGREFTPRFASVDIEGVLYDIVEEATRSIKGMMLAVYLLALAFGFALLFAVTLQLGTAAVTDDVWTEPRLAWGIGGFLLVLAAGSCYGTWCCIRLARRLPTLLRQRVDGGPSRSDDTGPISPRSVGVANGEGATPPQWWHVDLWEDVGVGKPKDVTRRRVPRRPVGTVIPPLSVVVLASVAFVWAGPHSWTFAVVWPPLLLALVGCLALTRRLGRRRLQHDDHAIVAGMAAFVLTIQVLGSLDRLVAALRAGAFIPTRLPFSVYVAAMLVWLGYLDDAFQYAERHDDLRRLAKGGYLLAFALVFGGLLPLVGGPYAGLFAIVVVLAAAGGAVLFVTGWYRL